MASDIFMSYGGNFVQFGILQGTVYFGSYNWDGTNCVPTHASTYLSSPHLFIGAELSNQPCETLRDLGVMGATGNWRHFGLRRNSDGTYYATLDQVTKYTTSIAFPAAMIPGVTTEANDTCTFVRTDAATSSGGAAIMWHDNHNGWQYWVSQINPNSLYHPSLWAFYRPDGTAKTFYASGSTPLPGEC